MTEREFYLQIQEDWYTEFVDEEIKQIVEDTNTRDEFFEFQDIPF